MHITEKFVLTGPRFSLMASGTCLFPSLIYDAFSTGFVITVSLVAPDLCPLNSAIPARSEYFSNSSNSILDLTW